MEGDLNAASHKIINLSDPVDDGDVINKTCLESTTNNFLRRDGSNSIEGELNLSNNKIVNINVAYPTSSLDVATKSYADYADDLGSGGRPSEYFRVRMVFRKWRLFPRKVWILYAYLW